MIERNESIGSLRKESSHRKLDVLPIKSKSNRSKKANSHNSIPLTEFISER